MMITISFWACIVFVLATSLYQGIKKHRLLYEIKVGINALKPAFAMVWSALFLVGAMNLMPAIKTWVAEVELIQKTSDGVLIIRTAPYFYLFTVLYIIYKTIAGMNIPFIGYNEKEKVWEKESEQRYKERMNNWRLKIRGVLHLGNSKNAK
jgi:hypothetical protein